MKKITNALIFTNGKFVKGNLVFDEKTQVVLADEKAMSTAEIIEIPDGAMVVPGFIDTHIHGAGGADAMDGNVSALSTIANTIAKEGTTSFLATTMTQSKDNIQKALISVRKYVSSKNEEGAELLGVHLEGPFISAKFCGAQPVDYIIKPSVEDFEDFNIASGGLVKIVTLAPEEDSELKLIKYLDNNGVISSAGHTSAGVQIIEKAIDSGLQNVTHTYNAQSPLHHREIGVVGSALLFDSLRTELICDGIHVSKNAVKLLYNSKQSDKFVLITDAMRAKGLPDGESELGGQKVIVKNGEARLVDGTLAGSVLRMNKAIKNLSTFANISIEKAIICATENPAKELGIFDDYGSIAVGKKANYAVLDKDFEVIMTIREGKIIYKR